MTPFSAEGRRRRRKAFFKPSSVDPESFLQKNLRKDKNYRPFIRQKLFQRKIQKTFSTFFWSPFNSRQIRSHLRDAFLLEKTRLHQKPSKQKRRQSTLVKRKTGCNFYIFINSETPQYNFSHLITYLAKPNSSANYSSPKDYDTNLLRNHLFSGSWNQSKKLDQFYGRIFSPKKFLRRTNKYSNVNVDALQIEHLAQNLFRLKTNVSKRLSPIKAICLIRQSGMRSATANGDLLQAGKWHFGEITSQQTEGKPFIKQQEFLWRKKRSPIISEALSPENLQCSSVLSPIKPQNPDKIHVLEKEFTVFVKDINDNTPKFSQTTYQMSIKENGKAGEFIKMLRIIYTVPKTTADYSNYISSKVLNYILYVHLFKNINYKKYMNYDLY